MRQKDAELSARIIQSQALWMKDKRLLACLGILPQEWHLNPHGMSEWPDSHAAFF